MRVIKTDERFLVSGQFTKGKNKIQNKTLDEYESSDATVHHADHATSTFPTPLNKGRLYKDFPLSKDGSKAIQTTTAMLDRLTGHTE